MSLLIDPIIAAFLYFSYEMYVQPFKIFFFFSLQPYCFLASISRDFGIVKNHWGIILENTVLLEAIRSAIPAVLPSLRSTSDAVKELFCLLHLESIFRHYCLQTLHSITPFNIDYCWCSPFKKVDDYYTKRMLKYGCQNLSS